MAGLVGALALGLLVVPGAGTAGASFPGENGRIAYEQLADLLGDSSQVRTVLPDGSEVRELTPSDGNASNPVFSANGAWIAYVDHTPAGQVEIFRMGADGQAKKQLTRNGFLDQSPAWSPNNRSIAFTSHRRQGTEIFVMNRNGRGVRRVTRNRQNEADLTWSPDGRWIAFTRSVGTTGKPVIFIVRSDGRGKPRPITVGSSPTWAPNGRWLAFARVPGGSASSEIFRIHRSRRGQQQLTQGDGLIGNSALHPEWSPDGRWIAYALDAEEIRLVRPSGDQDHRILRAGAPIATRSWQAK